MGQLIADFAYIGGPNDLFLPLLGLPDTKAQSPQVTINSRCNRVDTSLAFYTGSHEGHQLWGQDAGQKYNPGLASLGSRRRRALLASRAIRTPQTICLRRAGKPGGRSTATADNAPHLGSPNEKDHRI